MAKPVFPFEMPSDQDFADVVRDFKLDTARAHALKLALRHAQEDLLGFFRTRIERKHRADMVKKLKKFDRALEALIAEVGSDVESFNDILPFDAREAIAAGASAELIDAVTGKAVMRDGERLEYASHAAGLLHGARLFVAQLERVKTPVAAFLKNGASDVGGREPDFVRHYLIHTLAEAAPEILGRRATGTAKGPFVGLAASVLTACGLSDVGVEKLIEHVLKAF